MSVERNNFSERLRKALAQAGYAPDSPTELAREFNHRFTGEKITIHAARKWLHAEAIPTQEKLRVLADLLGCDLGWLRFGDGASATQVKSGHGKGDMSAEARQLLSEIRRLDPHHRALLKGIIRVLAKSSSKSA